MSTDCERGKLFVRNLISVALTRVIGIFCNVGTKRYSTGTFVGIKPVFLN
jgi:hypothetical protein